MSKNDVECIAANGGKISNYGERRVVGYADDAEGIGMKMQRAGAQKASGSPSKMNATRGSVVALGGEGSYARASGQATCSREGS